ncbi:YybH family protein [Bacillus sonorensis]|uniref:YybH family protein n=1 Tax=Bacillus sonorensis TaxID=119858 RepID=UPI0004975B7F|nr:nuclear transport factor 2 family protein [Bacillus sonorensis]MCY8271140.1 nuclear transport factor 2 family protein [Bacillus sonorensis]MCY8406057.1 nuclear transport factor 2 family protein [Bacillus sonorensis]MCY8564788.1 nuclear transport factor 2 family protein [Bacillus sonorensis]MCY8606299.1 nuclear transport factor 2 family protein [Bacillus sonorensis]MCZ0069283.1 nuclear transport factor 2 family protein [Bacillus sonorensis]
MSCRKALDQYIKATNTHVFANVKELLDRDAVYWFSDQTCSGFEEIQRYFENAWKQIENEVYSAKDVSWITETDEQAVCLYTYEWKGFYQGEPVSGAGRATNVFIKDESGNWKLKHEHLSSLPKS